jgi:hypothetical protein
MKLKNLIPAVFFFIIGIAASYVCAALLGLAVFSALHADEADEDIAQPV